jgi:hypothetical protein
MEPILVPGPPKAAFNKNRRMSDLIRKQIEHFKHLEEKLPPEVRATLPQHNLITEDDAARYIGPMTRLLRSRTTAAATPPLQMPQPPAPGRDQQSQGLDLAAAATPEIPNPAAAKKSPGKPRKKTP